MLIVRVAGRPAAGSAAPGFDKYVKPSWTGRDVELGIQLDADRINRSTRLHPSRLNFLKLDIRSGSDPAGHLNAVPFKIINADASKVTDIVLNQPLGVHWLKFGYPPQVFL